VNDFICKCKSGFEGNGIKGKCYVDESVGLFLVYAQGASLHKSSFKSSSQIANRGQHDNRIVHIPGQTAVGLSYDCHEQFIYWSDVSGNLISRIRYDGSNYSVVLQNVKSAEGLAVDWISRNIYFTDAEARTIEVASLSGKYRKVLINTDLKNPRGIAVDPIDGYIFWCDWNRKSPKIERANMDGTQRKIIIHNDLGVPNGLYFDQKRQEICWGDAKTKRIECCAKDGSNRRIVTQMSQMYPFDLTEVRSNIYWSDWSNKDIQNVDKDGILNVPIKLSTGGNGRVYGIVAVKNNCQKGMFLT
jgi:nidogen (entactin)